MRGIRQFYFLIKHVSLRWRLMLVSLGLLTILLGSLGILVLFTANQALLVNQSIALQNEAHVATNGIKARPFKVVLPPGPPVGPLSANLKIEAAFLVQKLTSPNTNATILSTDGQTLLSGGNTPISPAYIPLPPAQVQQQLSNNQDENKYLLMHDSQKQHQLIVIIPLVNDHHMVALLQLSTIITSIDTFITTLRITLLLGGLGALALAASVMFPLITAALYPLVEMERASRKIAAGKLSMRLNVPVTDDEIGHLARSFNIMVERLEEAFAHQKRFVADVSHELRTPLTALSGSLEMLLIGADNGDPEAARRLTHGMYSEVQRMHRLVEDLLALTRLDENKIVLREETIDVQTLIDKVCNQAQHLAHGQEITQTVAPDTLPVRADSDRLQQVLLNIIDNALKFTPANGRVELLGYNKDETDVVLEVRDTGKGISAEALPHVFDRFYRADPSRSRLTQKVGGNGLGLAIAKELVEAQNGTITINSTLREGTLVSIQFPGVSSTMNDTKI
jgi:two-component system, OmpR family, sensor kinase